jgi:hypothetical protein
VTSDEFFKDGSDWHIGDHQRDMYGTEYYYNTHPDGQHAGWKFQVPETGLYEVCIWDPEDGDHAPDVPFTVQHADGTDTFYINQRAHGGRWLNIGDFNFVVNQTSAVYVEAKTVYSDSIVAIDALKLTKWPNCNFNGQELIPATTCPKFNKD